MLMLLSYGKRIMLWEVWIGFFLIFMFLPGPQFLKVARDGINATQIVLVYLTKLLSIYLSPTPSHFYNRPFMIFIKKILSTTAWHDHIINFLQGMILIQIFFYNKYLPITSHYLIIFHSTNKPSIYIQY